MRGVPLRPLAPTDHNVTSRRRRSAAASADRFVPSRATTNISNVSTYEVEKGASSQDMLEANASPAKEEYKKRLAAELFRGEPSNNRVLNFCTEKPAERPTTGNDTLRMLYTLNRQSVKRTSWSGRPIPQSPERILDAPELMDDYYLNLLDWNADNILGARP